jgi:hypothetical protein
MYMKINLESTVIDLTQYCIEKVIEVCAAQIKVINHFIILLCISPLLVSPPGRGRGACEFQ